MTTPDLVLYHGRVLTLDAASRVAEAVAVAGDRIAAVGGSAELLALAGPATRRVDLAGSTVVPGLVDAHAHLDREGLKAVCPSLADVAFGAACNSHGEPAVALSVTISYLAAVGPDATLVA